jgi:hypothetical protein
MRIAVVAGHDVAPSVEIASKLAAALAWLADEDGELLVRSAALADSTLAIERMAVELADIMGVPCVPLMPFGWGRGGVYDRDIAMVEKADRVIAFFHSERIMEGGTGHVVEVALRKYVPIDAWAVDDSGNLLPVGSDEGYDVGEGDADWLHRKYQEQSLGDYEERLTGLVSTTWAWDSTTWTTTTWTTTTPATWITSVGGSSSQPYPGTSYTSSPTGLIASEKTGEATFRFDSTSVAPQPRARSPSPGPSSAMSDT